MAQSLEFLKVMATDDKFQAEVYCPNGFQDMTILDHHIFPGRSEWVPVRVALRMMQSNPDCEIANTRGPNPKKKATRGKSKT